MGMPSTSKVTSPTIRAYPEAGLARMPDGPDCHLASRKSRVGLVAVQNWTDFAAGAETWTASPFLGGFFGVIVGISLAQLREGYER